MHAEAAVLALPSLGLFRWEPASDTREAGNGALAIPLAGELGMWHLLEQSRQTRKAPTHV
jgi:hypothetical protein